MNKSLILSAVALAAASVAVPAAAQSYGHGPGRGHDYGYGPGRGSDHGYGGWQPVSQRAAQLDRRIERGVQTGQLTRREAASLSSQLQSLVRLERSYGRNGFSRSEIYDLDRRYDQLASRVRWERRDDDRYGRGGYGYGHAPGYRY